MSAPNCSGCGAPASPSAFVCTFCGTVLRTPESAEDEMDLLRRQALVAQDIAAGKMRPKDPKAARYYHPSNAVLDFWRNAFVPHTVPGLRLALEQCVARAKITEFYTETFEVFKVRAEALSMLTHPLGLNQAQSAIMTGSLVSSSR